MHMSTSNSKHDWFFTQNNENTYPNDGRALMQMYSIVPQPTEEIKLA